MSDQERLRETVVSPDARGTSDVRSRQRMAVAALVGANLSWGASFVLGKAALAELAPSHVVVGRFLIGALCLAPWLVTPRWRGLRAGDVAALAAAGALMVPVMMWLQTVGLALTSATNAALIVGTLPVLLGLTAVAVDREPLTGRLATVIGVSTAGATLLVGRPHAGGELRGDLLVLASMLAACAWVLLSRRLVERHGASFTTSATMLLGSLLMAPVAIWRDGLPGPISATAGAALLGLAVGCTALSYGLWNWGLQYLSASRAGVFSNLEPLVGAVLGVAILGEVLRPGTALGGLLILAAAVIASLPEARPAVAVAAPGVAGERAV